MRWHWRDALERCVERLWYGPKGWLFGLLVIPLGMLTPLFRYASHRRRRAHAAPAPLPLIGIGNLVAGGSGKTQVVLELGLRAIGRGLRPALLTRGYGVHLSSPVRVTADSPGTLGGDEACLLAKRINDAFVIAGPDRLESARLARQLGATLAILDDGLQQRRVAVDRKVWVFPAETPFGNGHLLPLGPLRDPPEALSPHDLVWLHGDGAPPSGMRIDVASRSRPVGLVPAFDLRGPCAPSQGMAVAAFSGIARPQRFLASLRELGLEVRRHWARSDHRVFGAAELQRAAEIARAEGAAALVCTEKDAVRLPPIPLPIPVFALRAELHILSGEEAIDSLFGDTKP
jgi:tetraacyldisaccharide 4'-kinase